MTTDALVGSPPYRHDSNDEVLSPYLATTATATTASSSSSLQVAVGEAMNPEKRCSMEDASRVLPAGTWQGPPEWTYLAIYDGHGGRRMVEFLKHALEFHVAQEMQVHDGASLEEQITRAFLITDAHAQSIGITTSGATVALLLIRRNHVQKTVELVAANVGDARIVLHHQGHIARITTDHTSACPMERARIEKSGGVILRQRVMGVLAVTRSMGDAPLKPYVIATPSIQHHIMPLHESPDPAESAFLIVACDGLWDVMSDEQAVRIVQEFVREYPGQHDACVQHLIQTSLDRGSTDNITCLIVWL